LIELGDDLALFTFVLKSALSLAMVPDTWLPTSTVTTACRVPVDETT
jgi:hypothetical protein